MPIGHMEYLKKWECPVQNLSRFLALCWHIERFVDMAFQTHTVLSLVPAYCFCIHTIKGAEFVES